MKDVQVVVGVALHPAEGEVFVLKKSSSPVIVYIYLFSYHNYTTSKNHDQAFRGASSNSNFGANEKLDLFIASISYTDLLGRCNREEYGVLR